MKQVYPETSGGWKKYNGNPVLGGPEMGTCFDVFVIREAGEFQMHFSWRPKGSLAVCRSTDGIHWSEPEILLEPNPDSGWEDRLNRNCVVRREDEWHMWYTGQAGGNSWIGYATSKDGHHWTRVSDQPVLYSERPYEGPSVMNPFVIWDEEMHLFRMWYAAGEAYEPNVLAYATSTDGIQWDKLPANPIFRKDSSHPFEQDRVGACQLVRADGWYYMFYIGYEDIDTARVCLARSRNGVTNWQRFPSPIVSPTPDAWDADACYKPSVFRDEENNRWLLWYNGRHGSPEYVGLVTHEGLDLGFDR
jgi:sucrose-6-phosphate hydrolase SacC (GH32 family)